MLWHTKNINKSFSGGVNICIDGIKQNVCIGITKKLY